MSLKIEVTGQGNLDRAPPPPSVFCELEDLSAKREGRRPGVQSLRAGGRASIEWPPRNPRCFVQLLRSRPAPVPDPVDRADKCGDRRNPWRSCDTSANLRKSIPKVTEEPATGLRPNHFDEGRFVATLLPPYRRLWFWPVVTVPWLALTILAVRPRERAASARIRRGLCAKPSRSIAWQ